MSTDHTQQAEAQDRRPKAQVFVRCPQIGRAHV